MAECTRCGWTGPAAPQLPALRSAASRRRATPGPRWSCELEAARPAARDVGDHRRHSEIGRLDESSDITIPHKSVSRQHARILPTPTGFEVEDLGSTNGTYLNDQPISDRTPLSNNDLLMIGDVPVRVVLRKAPGP